MRLVLLLVMFIVARIAVAGAPDTWTPKLQFQLEKSDYTQTLIWISGYGYALTEIGHKNNREGRVGGLCVPNNKLVDSRLLVDALNSKFKGQRITSEQASPVLLRAAESTYRCPAK
ncbi:MAG: hypothetical protein ACREVQ_10845 [Burkholderiales bacterium]